MGMTIQQAIDIIEARMLIAKELRSIYGIPEVDMANEMAIDALREKAEREDPKPLTLEELRQMDGEPVWIKADHYGVYADVVRILGKEDGDAFIGFKINHRLQENGYGKTWEAYRHKPKEAE